MGDHELMHAAHPAMYNNSNNGGGAGTVSNGAGMWWNTVPAAACSTEQLAAGFGGTWQSALAGSGYDVVAAAEGGKAKTCAAVTPASSESPGNNSSITFQESTTGCCLNDPAAAGFTDWNHAYMSSGTGAGNLGFLQVGHVQDNNMSAARADHSMNASSLMSNNNLDLALQGGGSGSHHEQQLLSSLGQQAELLLSPTSPYGFHSSSLLRSLMDHNQPTANKSSSALGIQQQQQYNQYGQQQQQQQMVAGGGRGQGPLQFTNDAAFWNNNPSAAAGFGGMMAAPAADQAAVRATVKQSSPAPPRAANLALKNVLEGVGDSSSITSSRKKASGEPAFKKPRMATPSPLPTFKVRKEKLGDRITALQQLVSPFGKTDTASVLHETIEYVKFLHDQVGVLSAPYLKNGNHHHHQVPQYLKSSSASPDKPSKDGGEVSSLKGRGLCLVPISSTFAVASEVPVDFWTPFGAGFR